MTERKRRERAGVPRWRKGQFAAVEALEPAPAICGSWPERIALMARRLRGAAPVAPRRYRVPAAEADNPDCPADVRRCVGRSVPSPRPVGRGRKHRAVALKTIDSRSPSLDTTVMATIELTPAAAEQAARLPVVIRTRLEQLLARRDMPRVPRRDPAGGAGRSSVGEGGAGRGGPRRPDCGASGQGDRCKASP